MIKKFIVIVLCISLVFTASFGTMFYYLHNNCLAVVGKDFILMPEYYVYLEGQKQLFEGKGGNDIWNMQLNGGSTTDAAKKNALSNLETVKIADAHAKDYGISLTDDDRNKAMVKADETASSLDEQLKEETGIDSDVLYSVACDIMLFKNVYTEITKNYVLSDEEYNQLLEADKKNLDTVMISYVYISSSSVDGNDSVARADEVEAKVKDGTDFDTLISEYSDDYDKDVGIQSYEASEENFPNEVVDAAYTMKVGQISDVISTEVGCYIIRVDDIIEPDEAYVQSELRDNYTKVMKNKVFDESEKTNRDNTFIKVNDALYNNAIIY